MDRSELGRILTLRFWWVVNSHVRRNSQPEWFGDREASTRVILLDSAALMFETDTPVTAQGTASWGFLPPLWRSSSRPLCQVLVPKSSKKLDHPRHLSMRLNPISVSLMVTRTSRENGWRQCTVSHRGDHKAVGVLP